MWTRLRDPDLKDETVTLEAGRRIFIETAMNWFCQTGNDLFYYMKKLSLDVRVMKQLRSQHLNNDLWQLFLCAQFSTIQFTCNVNYRYRLFLIRVKYLVCSEFKTSNIQTHSHTYTHTHPSEFTNMLLYIMVHTYYTFMNNMLPNHSNSLEICHRKT